MNVIKSLSTITMISLLLFSTAVAQLDYNTTDWGVNPMAYSRVGTAGWQFLKLPTNARTTAMGGVRAAVAYGDANAAFTNPAAAADVDGNDLQMSSMKWVADIQYSGLSMVTNLGSIGTIGVNLVYMDYGRMTRTEIGDLNGEPGMIAVTSGLPTFTAHDLAFGILYSRKITDKLQIGGNIRFLEEQLFDDVKTRNWSIDIGTLYWTGLGSWRISMLGKNFGPDAVFDNYADRLQRAPIKIRMPMMFIFGTAYDLIEMSEADQTRLTIAGEYIKPNDGPEKINIGAEYFFFHNIYLRGGYRINYDEERYTLGFGAEYSLDGIVIKIDYAYADVGRFKYVNMFTIGLGF